MRKFIAFASENYTRKLEITPLNYEEFMALDMWSGASDIAYSTWKYHNKFVEINDFNDDALAESRLFIELGEPTMAFNPSGEPDLTWIFLTADHNFEKQGESLRKLPLKY